MANKEWMSWEGGVDVAGFTAGRLATPNVLVHVARVVHTPFGSAPAGMIVWQPDPKSPPVLAGFICTDATVGGYFGSRRLGSGECAEVGFAVVRQRHAVDGDECGRHHVVGELRLKMHA